MLMSRSEQVRARLACCKCLAILQQTHGTVAHDSSNEIVEGYRTLLTVVIFQVSGLCPILNLCFGVSYKSRVQAEFRQSSGAGISSINQVVG